MKPDYTALDAAILEHIRSGSPWHPKHGDACRRELSRINPAWMNISYLIGERLQSLRKAGKIRHIRPFPCGAGHGWTIAEEPTNA